MNNTGSIRKNTIWNAAASAINASEAVIVVAIASRVNSLTEAGILTIAFSLATLFMAIGKFGIRNYQVAHEGYDISFFSFLKMRFLTVFLMIITAVAYVMYNSFTDAYSYEKVQIILGIIAWYSFEAVEDVFMGSYQSSGRLDVGCKIFIIRWLVILCSFSIVDIFLHDLVLAIGVSLFAELFVGILLLVFTYKNFGRKDKELKSNWSQLLKYCLPLVGTGFAFFYMANIPKYVIDAKLNDDMQAIYGYISLPVFVISVLNSIIYQPKLTIFVKCLREKKYGELKRRILEQLAVIAGIMVVVVIGAAAIGIQVLSLLYHMDLMAYKINMLVLLISGGLFAVGGFSEAILTIMDKPHKNLEIYVLTIIFGTLIVTAGVRKSGIEGAVWGYFVTMLILAIMFQGVLWKELLGLKKKVG